MTTATKIKPQTIPAEIPVDAERIQTLGDNDDDIFVVWHADWRAWRQRAPRSIAPTPNMFRLLINAEWHTCIVDAPQREGRAAQLRELARWSVTEADLDWGHLADIDRTGWGTAA